MLLSYIAAYAVYQLCSAVWWLLKQLRGVR
jgi:hypothetical protein